MVIKTSPDTLCKIDKNKLPIPIYNKKQKHKKQ